jgi:cell division protein FtsB
MSKGPRNNASIVVTLVVIAAIAFIALFGYPFIKEWLHLKSLHENTAAKSQELAALNKQNEDLQKQLDDSKTDSFVERMARELLGWVKQGEYKIVDQSK